MRNIKHVWYFSRPQPTTTDPYRTPATKELFETDSQKPLIGNTHIREEKNVKTKNCMLDYMTEIMGDSKGGRLLEAPMH